MTKIVFIEDSTPVPYELDGIAGDMMDEIKVALSKSKEDETLTAAALLATKLDGDGKRIPVMIVQGSTSDTIKNIVLLAASLIIDEQDPIKKCVEFSDFVLHVVQDTLRKRKTERGGLITSTKKLVKP